MVADGSQRSGAWPAAEFAEPLYGTQRDNSLEVSIGRQVRAFRRKLDMTVVELAKTSGMSAGMLSKIENGITSPSLSTLQALSRALNVPVTALFRKYEELEDATVVRAGAGLRTERRGTRNGHGYQLLGHSLTDTVSVEPFLITIETGAEPFAMFQHSGTEFIYVLEGELAYRHGDKSYTLGPGDSIFFNSDAPHGPTEFHSLPIRLVCVMVDPRAR